jgi:hypothetical protein
MVHLSILFLLAFVVCERFQHLSTLVLTCYVIKRIIAFGFSAIGKLSVHRLPNQALKLTELAYEQFTLRVKFEWNWKESV